MRILFVKTSSLGDVIHNCPAVSDAARHVHGARIDWVVEEPFAGLAAMHRAVRRVIPVAVRRWRRAPLSRAVWSEVAAFRRNIAAERYDAIVDTQGLLKSALLASRARGTCHGYDRASAREPVAARLYGVRHAVPRTLHAVERNRRLAAAALGYVAAGACDYGLRAPAEPPLPIARPYCVLLTMTSRADKLWPEEHWIALAKALAGLGRTCVLPWGGEVEKARCERIAASVQGALVPRRLELRELAALVARAHIVAGVDTGLTHLAAALGTPSAGIYCGSNPALTGLHGTRSRNLGGAASPPSPDEVLAALEAFA